VRARESLLARSIVDAVCLVAIATAFVSARPSRVVLERFARSTGKCSDKAQAMQKSVSRA
jgi:hypothetical protein